MKANGTSEEKERGGSSLFCGNVQQKARPFDQANKAGFPGACVNMNHEPGSRCGHACFRQITYTA